MTSFVDLKWAEENKRRKDVSKEKTNDKCNKETDIDKIARGKYLQYSDCKCTTHLIVQSFQRIKKIYKIKCYKEEIDIEEINIWN